MSRTRHSAQKMPSGPRSRKRTEQRMAARRVRQKARRLVRESLIGDPDKVPTALPAPHDLYLNYFW